MTDPTPEMHIDPTRATTLAKNLSSVQQRITAASRTRPVRLVAISKLKPANDILALHRSPARHDHFGENYAQELLQKAALLPLSVRWHFVGALQSRHCKTLARIPNLFAVSSVDSAKKARLLCDARAAADPALFADHDHDHDRLIGVHVQVNTSGEESKSGCCPGDETVALCREVVRDRPNLRFLGLMTIGAIARSKAAADATDGGRNEDFTTLCAQRDLVARELGIEPDEIELSMGMSDDFETAIAQGSNEVRIGSTIFGQRPDKADAKISV